MTTLIPSDVWVHIAMTYDTGAGSSGFKTYLNGIEYDSNSSSNNPIGLCPIDLIMGAAPWYPPTLKVNGDIDEVRIWNTVLSESTIQNWMYENVDVAHPNYGNLVSYWEMNDYETPDTAQDSIGNSDGDIYGATYVHISENPMFYLNPTSLDFGDVIVDDSETLQFTITNNGTGTLSGTITTPTGYSVAEVRDIVSKDKDNNERLENDKELLHHSQSPDWECNKTINNRNEISYNIATSQTYNLTFEPTSIQNYDGNVVITGNDPANPTNNLAVYGDGIGLDVPIVSISENGVNVTLN